MGKQACFPIGWRTIDAEYILLHVPFLFGAQVHHFEEQFLLEHEVTQVTLSQNSGASSSMAFVAGAAHRR